MSYFKSIILFIFWTFIGQNVSAQFVLSGEFRPRTEINRGYKALAVPNQDPSTFTTQRSRLNALFSNDLIRTKLVIQDVRTWGSQPQLIKNEDYAISIHEGWGEILFTPEFSIKAGRQEVVYDDHRIFGSVGWAQQARSHDMAILKYEKEFKIHVGIAHNENETITDNIYDGPDAYKDLQFGWFNKTWEKSSVSLLFLNNGVPVMEDNEQVNKYSQTIGGRYTIQLAPVNLASNLYYQGGKHSSGKDISALNFLLEASLKAFNLGFEHLSGTAWNEGEKYNSFTPFYGTNHKFNGFMDYFYVGNHIGSVGLNDIYLKYKLVKDKFGFDAHIHAFSSAAELSENADRYLGTELDLAVSWAVKPMAKISIGYSTLFASESMEFLKGGDSSTGQHWAYIMLGITPTFIK